MNNNQTISTLPIEIIQRSILPMAQIPVAVEIEQAVLGVLLSESSYATEQALLTLTEDSFTAQANKVIFQAIRTIEKQGKKIDLLSVSQALKETHNLDVVGGASKIVELSQSIGSGAHLEQHVRILIENQIGRQLAVNGYQTMCQVLTGSDVDDVIKEAQNRIDQVMTVGFVDSKRRHISDILVDAIDQAHKREQNSRIGKVTGITTGLKELDRITNGWQAQQLIILAARPAMGKTALMLHFALSAAKTGFATQIYSLEMGSVSLANRLITSQCNADPNSFKSGRDIYWTEIDKGVDLLKTLPIHIDEKAGVSMRYITTHSKIMHRRGQCDLILIDYLQLINTKSVGRNREQEVAECSRMAKELAKELSIPVIMLAQLSRAVEGRGGSKKPMLSDLRESGAIEQDADIVLFPHRQEYYENDKEYTEIRLSNGKEAIIPLKGFGTITVAKQRDGATGEVRFKYNEFVNKFTDFDEREYANPNYTPLKNTYESIRQHDDDMPF